MIKTSTSPLSITTDNYMEVMQSVQDISSKISKDRFFREVEKEFGTVAIFGGALRRAGMGEARLALKIANGRVDVDLLLGDISKERVLDFAKRVCPDIPRVIEREYGGREVVCAPYTIHSVKVRVEGVVYDLVSGVGHYEYMQLAQTNWDQVCWMDGKLLHQQHRFESSPSSIRTWASDISGRKLVMNNFEGMAYGVARTRRLNKLAKEAFTVDEQGESHLSWLSKLRIKARRRPKG